MQYTFRPTSILTNKSVPADLVDEDEVSSLLNIKDMKESFAETMEMLYAMVYIMVIGAVLLGVVVLYNLGVLSFVEKTREVATLKVCMPAGPCCTLYVRPFRTLSICIR